jgi:hypothetical protein
MISPTSTCQRRHGRYIRACVHVCACVHVIMRWTLKPGPLKPNP